MDKKIKEKRRWKPSGRTLRNWVYAYIFLAPWLIGFFLLVAYTLERSFYFSRQIVAITPVGMVFIPHGFTNYADLMQHTFFIQNLVSFVIQSALQIPVIVSFALIIAILLNGKIRARGMFRAIFFLPVIIATGPVMNELTGIGAATVPAVNTAAIAGALSFLPPMVQSPVVSLFGQLIMILWNSGIQILIFLAALQKISVEQYEAAKIDGASGWECFWKITAPAIKPMVFLNAIYTVVWLATSGQNPVIDQIAFFMHSGFYGYGFASAAAFIYSGLVLLLLLVCFLILRTRKEKVPKLVKRLDKRNW
ncbi:MAG: sugar ABC transporter permease [Defluviitaleaceae bacterium]|nr:sugar ABC transporter permease [Defluviitaleaceae bacterium]MCL2238923.1 sugar ABC transporter permease [Defluviitaleaceae bacterium]